MMPCTLPKPVQPVLKKPITARKISCSGIATALRPHCNRAFRPIPKSSKTVQLSCPPDRARGGIVPVQRLWILVIPSGSMIDDGMAGTAELLIRNCCKPFRMIELPLPVSHQLLTDWRKVQALRL